MAFSFPWSQQAGAAPGVPNQQGIDRRKQLAEALMRVGQQGTGLSGPWGAIASALAGGVAGYQQRKAGEEQTALNDDKKTQIAKALAGMGGDPAALSAAGQLPLEQQQTLLGNMLTNKLQPKPKQREAFKPGDVIYEDGKELARIPDRPNLPPGMRVGESGQPEYIPGYLEGQERVRSAGRPSTSINLPENKYPSKFADSLAELDAKRLGEYQKSAEASTGTIRTLTELEKLNPTALEGGGAESRAKVANFLKGFTGVDIVDPKVLADTQNYNAVVSKSILDQLGGSLGAGTSNADVAFVQRIVPQLEYSREARQQLIDYLKQRAAENVQLYQRAREYGEKNNGLKGFDAVGNSLDRVSDEAPEYTATGANGEKIVWRNGQWVPADAPK